ncbi:MAG: TldD/PmbA family protein [Pseudohongiellaceae bacterium]
MAEARGLSSDDLKAISDRILELSEADHCRVRISSGWQGYTRVATNRVTSAGGSEKTSVNITSIFGNRVASVETNRLSDDELRAAVRRSEDMARIAPIDNEYMPEAGPTAIAPISAYYSSTGDLTPETRAEAAALAIQQAQDAGQIAASYMDVNAGSRSLATSNGFFGSHASTGVAYTLTCRSPDGLKSGWAGDEANDWNNIESQRIATDAVQKCRDWRKTALEPGEYTAILEPTAVGMLMRNMVNAFNQRTADEGRSFFSNPNGGNRIGENLFDDKVNIFSDPAYLDAETSSFNEVGQALAKQNWVNSGRLEELSRSRYWAKEKSQQPLASPSNLIMAGGDDSLEEMIASTRRGVLISRFWYIRGLNPRVLAYTGLTRDGTFLIENGRITRPVSNFRFNQSMVDLLRNIQMLSPAVRVAASESSSVSTPIVVPAIKVANFNLASVSDAI